MNNKHWHNPVLLLVDGERSLEFDSVRDWLAGREVVFYEASDVFDAVDELCDFTVDSSPDLILIPVRASGHCNAEFAKNLLGTVGASTEPNIVVYSARSKSADAVRDLDELGVSLSECFAYPPSLKGRSVSA